MVQYVQSSRFVGKFDWYRISLPLEFIECIMKILSYISKENMFHEIKETNKIYPLVILNNIWQRFRKMMINSITFLTLYATKLRYMSCRRNDTYLSEIMIYELEIFLPFLWHRFWFYISWFYRTYSHLHLQIYIAQQKYKSAIF